LSYLAQTQTNRQTKTDKNITSLAEVIIHVNIQNADHVKTTVRNSHKKSDAMLSLLLECCDNI